MKAKEVVKKFIYGVESYHCPGCDYAIGNDLMHYPVKKCPRCEQLLTWDAPKEEARHV